MVKEFEKPQILPPLSQFIAHFTPFKYAFLDSLLNYLPLFFLELFFVLFSQLLFHFILKSFV